MNLDETIRLHALKVKQLNTVGTDMDGLIDQFASQAVIEGIMKNICASVSLELFQRVDNLCDALRISKRRFVELAILDALKNASAVLDEVKPFEKDPS